MDNLLSIAAWCGSVVVLCFYGTYILLSVVALQYGRCWLHSKGSPVLTNSAGCNGVKRGVRNGTNGYITSSEHVEQPGVSIIKQYVNVFTVTPFQPVVGCDPNLRMNLETFFRLDYPKYELLFCIGEAHNPPSRSIITELISQHPEVDAKVFQGGELVGVNPKINNMMPAYKAAKYSLLWICDSDLLALPHTLTELVSHSLSPDVAVVHQLPYIVTAEGFAGCLNKVYFGTQHSRLYLIANWCGEMCANGLSWLLKKKALEKEGGLGAFAEYLAEDFFIGKALWLRGWRLALSTLPAMQNPGVRSLTVYKNRIIRWGRLRATMIPWLCLLEPFTECFGLGLLGSLCAGYLLGVNSFLFIIIFLLVHSAVWFFLDMLLMRTVENGPIGPLHHVFLAWCLRELWTFPLFLAGVWSREVVWKDQRYKLQFGGKAIKLD